MQLLKKLRIRECDKQKFLRNQHVGATGMTLARVSFWGAIVNAVLLTVIYVVFLS